MCFLELKDEHDGVFVVHKKKLTFAAAIRTGAVDARPHYGH